MKTQKGRNRLPSPSCLKKIIKSRLQIIKFVNKCSKYMNFAAKRQSYTIYIITYTIIFVLFFFVNRKHIRQHVDHSSLPCGSDRLAFGCRFCPKAFWTIDSKNAHQMRLHTNQMSSNDYIMCIHCGETMSSKVNILITYNIAYFKLFYLI